jgi:hypothetical protein
MKLSIEIPDSETELITWIKNIKEKSPNNENFNSKLVNMLNVYCHLVQNIEWTIFDKSIEKKWDSFEDHFQGGVDDLVSKLNQKIELLQLQLQESVSGPIKHEFQKLQETIDTFRGDTMISSKKGKMGEMKIQRQIEKYFPECELIDCSKMAHQSDHHLKLHGFTIFIEVKTYQKNVPHKEVIKFYRDLEENPDADAGILLSLSSGIANKPRICYEINSATGKPIVYVPNAHENDGMSVVWSILFAMLVLRYQKTELSKQTGSDVQDILEMVRNQLVWIEMAISTIGELKQISKKNYNTISQQLAKSHKEIHQKLDNSEKILQKNVDAWNTYLTEGKTVIVPLPSLTQKRDIDGYICSGCAKAYKKQNYYEKHIATCKKRT